jgi:CMP-N-acetylneuraminic acid synthetase
MTTVCYVAKPDFIISHNSIFEGQVQAVLIPPERSIDIDTHLDFEIAEFLLSKRNK